MELPPSRDPGLPRRLARHFAGHLGWSSLFTALGILLPLGLITYIASRQALAFDGAMNMQVAEHLASDGTYARTYGTTTVFPSEIQTSAYFLFISAAAIRAFGTSNLTLQAANIVFIALLLTATSYAVRPSRAARLLIPGALLFASPGLRSYSLGGYGEGAIVALAIAAFVLIASVASSSRNAGRRLAVAFALAGTAIAIKTVAIAVVPAALLGVLLIGRVRPEIRRWTLVLAPLATLAPILLFELYRWRSLRGGYVKYWTVQIHGISQQATGSSTSHRSIAGSAAKIADHFHLLAAQTGVPAEWWVALLLAATIGSILVIVLMLRSSRSENQTRQTVLLAELILHASCYFVWWLAVTPTEKAWLRRLTPGISAAILATLILATIVGSEVHRSAAQRRRSWRPAIALSLAALVAAAVVSFPTMQASAKVPTADNGKPGNVSDLAAIVTNMSRDGDVFYGAGWWSAPVVSLYSGVDFYDIQRTDVCSPQFQELARTGKAYLVWDFYAKALAKGTPKMRGLTFEDRGIGTSYGSLQEIRVQDGFCTA